MKALIIGHGPSGYKSGLGSFIDTYEGCVVRLASTNWQPAEDYGWRTDYTCATFNKGKRLHNDERRPTKEVWIYRTAFGVRSLLVKLSARRKKVVLDRFAVFNGPVICDEELLPWAKRYLEIQEEGSNHYYKHFSMGCAAIVVAAQRVPNIKEIRLLGFDNFWAGSREDYFRCGHRRVVGTSHNFEVEKILVQEVSVRYNVEIGPLNGK